MASVQLAPGEAHGPSCQDAHEQRQDHDVARLAQPGALLDHQRRGARTSSVQGAGRTRVGARWGAMRVASSSASAHGGRASMAAKPR
jgi:hypothetical protein